MGFQPFGKLKGLFRKSKSTLSLTEKDVGFSYSGPVSHESCSECNEVYNMGKKRKLIDVCGHHRCFTCITQNENCRLCGLQDPVGPAKKSLPFRQKFFSELARSPVPIQRSIGRASGHYSYTKGGTPAVVSSIYGTPRLSGAHRKIQPSFQESDFCIPRTPKSSLGRRSVLTTISRIQENEIYNSHLSENDEGFEDARKFKSFGSAGAYIGLDRFLNKRAGQGKSPSRMGRSSQFHTSCSSLASSTGSVTPSDHTNTLLSTSRTSYDSSSLTHHRVNGICATPNSGSALATKSPVIDMRQHMQVHTPRLSIRYPSCVRQEQLPLRPLFFEVPTQEEDPLFIGRQWLLHEMELLFSSEMNSNRGIIISGKSGSGKTSVLLQLVDHSCFGRRRNVELDLSYVSGRVSCEDDLSLSYIESIRSLASHVVAYQFCQVENNVSCLVPEFLHSIAAQLCQAPQLAAYREYLFEMPSCQKYLSKVECLRNPTEALMKGILEPLNYLYKLNKIANDYFVIVIDAVCEAEFHRSDSGDTISSFLSKNILKFPFWLKVIITIRSQHLSIVSLIPFYRIKLEDNQDAVTQDLFDYITHRLKKNSFRKNSPSGSKNESNQFAMVKRLIKLSAGNYLYAKLTLDLIENDYIPIKAPEFKELPKSLSDAFLKFCSYNFPTDESFAKVAPILSVCLAALNPLTLLEIYHSVNCLNSSERMTWESFVGTFQCCAQVLPKRSDGTYMLFHPSFRDWLLQHEETENKRFFCDLRIGHAAIAFRFSRIEAPLNEMKTLELGHHILKAHIYKNMPSSKIMAPPRDLQALWLANCSQDLSMTLASLANIYYPNIKVSRLLLLAGANPNERTQWRNAPLLAVCAGEGLVEMVSLLLEFGASINAMDEDGNTALHMAADNGQLDMVRVLVQQGAVISQVNQDEECALVKASISNRLAVVAFLLQQNWAVTSCNSLTLPEASQHALVAASAYGHIEIVEHIIQEMNPPVNCPDTLYGENPLCASCANGREEVVDLLLQHEASVNAVNMRDCPPLILAATGGHSSILKRLLDKGAPVNRADSNNRTALIVAAKEGHVDVVDLLLQVGADVNLMDKDGLTALSWASLRGQKVVVHSLLAAEADVNHADISGRTPLDLASYCGSEEITQLLLDRGALLEHVDLQGARPLDRAVGCGHQEVVQLFLKRGAKLGPATWTMATGKPRIILVLLNKLLEDGNVLYRKGQLKDAIYRYQYALRKIPVNEYDEDMQATFDEIKMTFMLHLSRCKRKMNEEQEAIHLASEVIKLQPNSSKAYHVRAKAYQAIKEITEALNDVNRAIELVGHNTELRRQLFRLKEEMTRESRTETRNMSPRLANPSLTSSFFKRSSSTSNTNTPTTASAENPVIYLKESPFPTDAQKLKAKFIVTFERKTTSADMKLPVSTVSSTLLCATLVSTLCLVLCFENEAERQRLSPLNLKENLDHSRWTPLNDRIALKDLYEMYREGEPMWKRAPAAGFYGMRGKKVPGQNFFGMRGKKGPSGFLGVRGKKMMESKYGLLDGFEPLDTDDLGDLWSSKEAIEHPAKQLLGDNLLADHLDNKRAPADGFMGLRGKRNSSPKQSSNAALH
ncbi:unnamed protein product [Allacma fusca]|uniref:Protein TANC2 n=1 Tax=Allacma fusca TaxID=39272 RepID=A0A8J2JAD8_9HEXA|nr:unnamed protein product [Allacma fusca]